MMFEFIEITSKIISWALVVLACGLGFSLTLSGFYILGKRIMINVWGAKTLSKFYAYLLKENKK